MAVKSGERKPKTFGERVGAAAMVSLIGGLLMGFFFSPIDGEVAKYIGLIGGTIIWLMMFFGNK